MTQPGHDVLAQGKHITDVGVVRNVASLFTTNLGLVSGIRLTSLNDARTESHTNKEHFRKPGLKHTEKYTQKHSDRQTDTHTHIQRPMLLHTHTQTKRIIYLY